MFLICKILNKMKFHSNKEALKIPLIHYQGFRFFSGESVNIDGGDKQAKVEICKLWS